MNKGWEQIIKGWKMRTKVEGENGAVQQEEIERPNKRRHGEKQELRSEVIKHETVVQNVRR